MYKAMTCLAGMTSCLAFCTPAQGATIYVDVDAAGGNNGRSWTDAYTSLPTGISRATAGDEVWVAEGTYGAITLKTGVRLYGGFAGTEGSASQSDPDAHVTYINKTGGDRPVTSIGNDSSTVLDGFYITGGFLGQDDRPKNGTGMYLERSNATIARCVFTNNTAKEVAVGTVATKGGSPTFVNCKFYGNDGGWGCGAFYNYASGSPTLVNCLFYENVVMYEGGAVCNNVGAITFTNCTLTDNRATKGKAGAVYDSEGDAVFRNCILWNNTALFSETNEILNSSAAPSPSTVTHSNVKGGWSGAGNLGSDVDPLFVDPANDDYRLQAGSPCRNAGHNASLPADVADIGLDGNKTERIPKDLALKPRVEGDSVDMGAFEWHPPTD